MIKCNYCSKYTEADYDYAFEYQSRRPFKNITKEDWENYSKLMCLECWLRISEELRNKTVKASDLKSSQEWYNYFNPDEDEGSGH